MKKKILIISAIVVVAVGIIGYNIIYKDHRNIKTEEAEFTLTAAQISSEFSAMACLVLFAWK